MRELKLVCEAIDSLYRTKREILNRLIVEGKTWQDIAKISRVDGIMEYHKSYPELTLVQCKKIVDNYLD